MALPIAVSVTSDLVEFKLTAATSVDVTYSDTSGTSSADSTNVNVTALSFDISDGYQEPILSGSARFKFGGEVYVENDGILYKNINPSTGVGTQAGTMQVGTGKVFITEWLPGVANTVVIQGLVTVAPIPPINRLSFRTPVTPVRPASVTVVIPTIDYGTLTVSFDEDGILETTEAHGFMNFNTGFADILLYVKTLITVGNRPTIEAYDWYDIDLEYTEMGDQYINVPVWIDPASVTYSGIAFSYIPLPSALLGVNGTRLPIDGRVPIFRVGDVGVVSASKSYQLPTNIAGTTYTLGDVRLSWVELQDDLGTKVNVDLYTVDYDLGELTLTGDFVMTGLTAPLHAKYRYQDMGLIQDVQINGMLTFTKPITHDYLAVNTIVGSALVIGDTQARYTNKFVQATWSNIWSDLPSGAAISSNYNDALYPVALTNNGAIQERWSLVFTDNINFRIIGEEAGQIGVGTINDDCAPINPVTGSPYFTLDKDGWGSGWVNGNALRFNTIAAMFPIWCIRTVKQSEPTVMSDQFQIMYRGDIDRVI